MSHTVACTVYRFAPFTHGNKIYLLIVDVIVVKHNRLYMLSLTKLVRSRPSYNTQYAYR